MNKKIEDTNEKIYNAFSEVLLLKDYNDVRIQDVLDKSGVARSTFYAHYKTKEDLLKSVCTTIFSHVFSHVLKEEMRAHCAKGNTVFFSTHVLEVAEKLCDRVGIIRNGELAAVGTLEELRAQAENGESSLEDIFLDIVNGGA